MPAQYAICSVTATWIEKLVWENNFHLLHGSLKNSTTQFCKCDDFKVRSICIQLCITLTCRPHLPVNLKSTFIQMCSVRWRLTLHNPSKCSIWRERLEIFESSERRLACREAVEKVLAQGIKTKKIEKVYWYIQCIYICMA